MVTLTLVLLMAVACATVAVQTPTMLTRSDVAFVVDAVGLVPTPGSCGEAPTESGDTQMWKAVLQVLEGMREETEDDEVKPKVIEKAIFLTKNFRPDYSQHPAPALGFQKALQGYLRRALLHYSLFHFSVQ